VAASVGGYYATTQCEGDVGCIGAIAVGIAFGVVGVVYAFSALSGLGKVGECHTAEGKRAAWLKEHPEVVRPIELLENADRYEMCRDLSTTFLAQTDMIQRNTLVDQYESLGCRDVEEPTEEQWREIERLRDGGAEPQSE
jgi:hypothetical protein